MQQPGQPPVNPQTQQSPPRPPSHVQDQQTPSAYAQQAGLKTSPGFGSVSVNAAGSKQKKNRKSPGPSDFEGRVSREDVQSPAYSDISDDSTPVAEQELLDKSVGQVVAAKHIELMGKKPPEVGVVGVPPAPAPNMYVPGMYQFYPSQQQAPPPPQQQQQQPQYMVQTEPGKPPGLPPALTQAQQQQQMQQGPPPPTSQPPSHLLGPPGQQSVAAHLADYSGKNKDPPLDLMTKPQPQPGQQPPQQQQQGQQPGSENNGKEVVGPPTSQPGSQPPPVNLSAVSGPPPGALPPGLGGLSALGAAGLGGPGPGKGMPHFYPFKYVSGRSLQLSMHY